MTGRNIGYARTATEGQEIDLQVEALKAAGCTEIFIDNGVSGMTLDRPGLQNARDALQSGDTFTVCKMDRISRSINDLGSFQTELRNNSVQLVTLVS